MSKLFGNLLTATALVVSAPAVAANEEPVQTKSAIILVHGAFAEFSSWQGVIARQQGHAITS